MYNGFKYILLLYSYIDSLKRGTAKHQKNLHKTCIKKFQLTNRYINDIGTVFMLQ